MDIRTYTHVLLCDVYTYDVCRSVYLSSPLLSPSFLVLLPPSILLLSLLWLVGWVFTERDKERRCEARDGPGSSRVSEDVQEVRV